MYMKRICYPVGHGGFSEEVFFSTSGKELSMVYDCGCSKKVYGINSLDLRDGIYNWLEIDNSIDLVFISHYHDDHINLLYELFSRYNIKNILLPQISPLEKLYYLLDICLKDKSKVFERDRFVFYERLFSRELEKTNVHFYYPEDASSAYKKKRENDKNVQIKNKNIDIRKLAKKEDRSFSNGDIFTFSNFWRFIPYYRKTKMVDRVFINELNKHYSGLIDEDDDNRIDISLFEENFRDIMELFEELKEEEIEDERRNRFNPHKSNLTLYSGPIRRSEMNSTTDCLYTGDYYNSAEYVDSLVDFYKSKSVFQETKNDDSKHNTLVWPHHGDGAYYNEKLHKWFGSYIFFSNLVGEYTEISPHPRIRKTINSRSNIHWVNEIDFYQKQYYL